MKSKTLEWFDKQAIKYRNSDFIGFWLGLGVVMAFPIVLYEQARQSLYPFLILHVSWGSS